MYQSIFAEFIGTFLVVTLLNEAKFISLTIILFQSIPITIQTCQ